MRGRQENHTFSYHQVENSRNKKVLLPERKRHTARHVASTRYAALSNPDLVRGGYPGYPSTIQTWSGGYPGYPPTIQTWLGGTPSRPGQGGTQSRPGQGGTLGTPPPPIIQTWSGGVTPPTIQTWNGVLPPTSVD